MTAMPSPRPGKPRPLELVPRTLTAPASTPRSAAMRGRISPNAARSSGVRRSRRRPGCVHQPFSSARSRGTRHETGRCRRPSRRGRRRRRARPETQRRRRRGWRPRSRAAARLRRSDPQAGGCGQLEPAQPHQPRRVEGMRVEAEPHAGAHRALNPFPEASEALRRAPDPPAS